MKKKNIKKIKKDKGDAKITRRGVLRGVAAFVAGGFASEFVHNTAGSVYRTIFPEESVGSVEREALKVFFDSTDGVPTIFAGQGNRIGSIAGIRGMSNYLRFSASRLTSYIAKAFDLEVESVHGNGDRAFKYSYNKSALFLGSPVANEVTLKLLGYVEAPASIDGVPLNIPRVDMQNKVTRWAFEFGEEEYGVYGGKREYAYRTSNRTAKIVERPIYKLVDKKERKIISPDVVNNFIQNEWITITKFQELNTTKVVIAGMHGYSTEAFCRDLTRNLEEVARLSMDCEQFQILVPVSLLHSKDLTGAPCTVGTILWSGAQVHQIGA